MDDFESNDGEIRLNIEDLVGPAFPTHGAYVRIRELYNQTSQMINPTMPWPAMMREACHAKAVLIDKVVNAMLIEIEQAKDKGIEALPTEAAIQVFKYIGYVQCQLDLFHHILQNEARFSQVSESYLPLLQKFRDGEITEEELKDQIKLIDPDQGKEDDA